MNFTNKLLSCYRDIITSGDDICSDYTVEAGGEIFHCHRFVLSACSQYFRGLFRWDVNEKNRHSIRLKDISSKTFKVIYRFIYYHDNTLNEDNVLDVWKATDFLRIEFIVFACEIFALENINETNCHKYFCHAKLLSQPLLGKILHYMTYYFDQLKDSDCILELEPEEMLSIVRDPNLKTSREENVVETVLKWVSHSCDDQCISNRLFSVNSDITTNSQPFESVADMSETEDLRADCLIPLLSVARLITLSDAYLCQLSQHVLIAGDKMAEDLLHKVWMYRSGCRINYRPTFACHRQCNQWIDVLLMPNDTNTIVIYSMIDKKMIGMTETAELPKGSFLNVHKNQAYLCGYPNDNRDALSMFLLVNNQWQIVALVPLDNSVKKQGSDFQAPDQTFLSFSLGDHVFVVHYKSGAIFIWDPLNCSDLRQLTSVPSDMSVINAMAFNNFIVVISGGIFSSALFNLYDAERRKWVASTPLDDLFDTNISLFQKRDKLYLLTSRGKMYLIDIGVGEISIDHMTTFSNFNCSIIGAMVYCDDLFVFVRVCTCNAHHGLHPHTESIELPELFDNVHVIGTQNPCTTLIPSIVPRMC